MELPSSGKRLGVHVQNRKIVISY